jgi:hypothetical protein
VKVLSKQEPPTMIVPAPAPEVKPASLSRILTDAEFSAWAGARLVELDADEHLPSAGPEVEPIRFDAEPPAYEPSPEEVAEWISYTVHAAGEEGEPPLGWSSAENQAYYGGMYRARMDRARASDAIRNYWVSRYTAPAPAAIHHAELVEGAGIDVARSWR